MYTFNHVFRNVREKPECQESWNMKIAVEFSKCILKYRLIKYYAKHLPVKNTCINYWTYLYKKHFGKNNRFLCNYNVKCIKFEYLFLKNYCESH